MTDRILGRAKGQMNLSVHVQGSMKAAVQVFKMIKKAFALLALLCSWIECKSRNTIVQQCSVNKDQEAVMYYNVPQQPQN